MNRNTNCDFDCVLADRLKFELQLKSYESGVDLGYYIGSRSCRDLYFVLVVCDSRSSDVHSEFAVCERPKT